MDDVHQHWCGLQGPSSGLELNLAHNQEPVRSLGGTTSIRHSATLSKAVRDINSHQTDAVQDPLELQGSNGLLDQDRQRMERIRRRMEKDTGQTGLPKPVRGRRGCKARLWGGEGLVPMIDHSPRVAQNLRHQLRPRLRGTDLAIRRKTTPTPRQGSLTVCDMRNSPSAVPRMRPQEVIAMARAQSTCNVGVLPQHTHLNSHTESSQPATRSHSIAREIVPEPVSWPKDETAVAKCATLRDDLIRRLYFAAAELDKV